LPNIAPEPQLHDLGNSIYGYVQPDGSWGLNNTGFLVGSDGVVIVDTCFTERRTRAFLDAIRTVTDLPLRILVNTHHHGDHTYGNWMLPAATIIGHERCREEMIATGLDTTMFFPDVEWGDIHIVPPFVTFQDRLNLYVNDLRVEAIWVGGPAHSTNDVVYWVPDRQLLFAGDLVFNGGSPFVTMGSVAGSLEALASMFRVGAVGAVVVA
jgi:cyclase